MTIHLLYLEHVRARIRKLQAFEKQLEEALTVPYEERSEEQLKRRN